MSNRRAKTMNPSPITIGVVAVLFLGLTIGGCVGLKSCERIEPGHVGVSIQKCGGGGVSSKFIPTGYYFKSPFCEDVVEYPTNLQTLVLTDAEGEGHPELNQSITVTSIEGMPISVDVSMSFTLDPVKVPDIYTKYRSEISNIARVFMRQTIREGLQMTFAKYTAEQLYADKKEVSRAESQAFLVKSLSPEGFIIQQFTINEIRVPKQVTDAINAKVSMKQEAQKAEAEVQKTRALAEQRKAEAEGNAQAARMKADGEAQALRLRADAEAYYNITVAKSLTPELVQFETAKKWNGQLPQFAGGGGMTPLINIGGQGK